MYVDVRREHRYSREVESMIRVSEKDFDVPVLNLYYS